MQENQQRCERLAAALASGSKRAQANSKKAERFESRFALARLCTTVALLALLVGVFPSLEVGSQIVGVACFVFLFFFSAFLHHKLKSKVRLWQCLGKSYEGSICRTQRDFASLNEGRPPWQERVARSIPSGHIYASDLDISTTILPLVDSCTTAEGSQRLLNLLLDSGVRLPDPKVRSLRKQRAIFLSRRTQFLRKFEAIKFDTDYLAEFLRHSQEETPDFIRFVLSQLRQRSLLIYAAAAITGVVGWTALLIPALVKIARGGTPEDFLHTLLVYSVLPISGALIFRPIADIASGLGRHVRVLATILGVVSELRKEEAFADFSCFRADARTGIRNLRLGIDLLSVRSNPIFWLALHALVPYDSLACAFLLWSTRRVARNLNRWRDDITEFDVICALARLARENPHLRFVSDAEESASSPNLIEAEQLGHPVLPYSTMIRNDFSLDANAPVVLLTGSNMSGKSTFLRTLGINLLFFNMGAPVCAERLQTVPRLILCAIRVDDSLVEGTSYFYAEVKRLRHILDVLDTCRKAACPALFLIDEIFRGTNNRERFVGSWHILHALLEISALGIVSTHDLALTELEAKDPRLRNMHFREHIEESRLAFDYAIKRGPCPTTNALHIMRSEGLPVPERAGELALGGEQA